MSHAKSRLTHNHLRNCCRGRGYKKSEKKGQDHQGVKESYNAVNIIAI